MSAVIESANPVVKAMIDGTAPRPAVMAAARGVLPLPQNDLLEVLVAFVRSDDKEVAAHARVTLTAQDPAALEGSARSADIAASVLDYFADQGSLPKKVQEAVVTNAKTPVSALVRFATTTSSGELLERLALNQQLLIQAPAIIDAIIANPNRTSEAERRAAETKREFFEKERGVQQIANELRAQGKEAAAEFIEQAEFAENLDESGFDVDDALLIASLIEVPDNETDDSWLGLEFIEEFYEETPEQRQAIADKILGEFHMEDSEVGAERVSVLNRVMKMGMKDRVKLAMKGDREARNILDTRPKSHRRPGRCPESADHRAGNGKDRFDAFRHRRHPAADSKQPPMVTKLHDRP